MTEKGKKKMKTDVATNEVRELLKESGGSYVEAYRMLVAKREEEAIAAERTTVAQRKQRHITAIKQGDQDALDSLNEKFVSALETIRENQISTAPGKQLTHEEAVGLMQEWLDQRDMAELLAARLLMIKEAVDNHITAVNDQDGLDNPEHHNGSLTVPELGHRFTKERTGRKDSKVNENKLRELLTDEEWESVCDVEVIPRQIIPRHKEYTFSPEKMMKLAQDYPNMLEKLLECLEVGGWKTPVITVRPLSS